MDSVQFILDVTQKAGVVGCLVMFAWFWLKGWIVSQAEMKRNEANFQRELKRVEEERDHARKECAEWKFMAMRGTDLAKYLGEQVSAKP